MLLDSYIPDSGNFLAPVAPIDPAEVTPERILEKLTACARLQLRAMQTGDAPVGDIIRTVGMFIMERRYVKVGITFSVVNDSLVEPPRAETLRSISLQLRAIYN